MKQDNGLYMREPLTEGFKSFCLVTDEGPRYLSLPSDFSPVSHKVLYAYKWTLPHELME